MPGPRGTKWASRRAAPGLLGPALPSSSQSDAPVRGVCLVLSRGPGLGGGVSGAVTSPRDPAGDVRGAARVVGARLARARVGGAGPGPRTLRPHDRGDGGGGAEAAARAPPGAASPVRWPCRPAGGAQPQVSRGWRARARAGARRPLSRDSEVGGQGGEGLGGACAWTRGAGLETHSH